MVKWVEIGNARLALGDCRDILPTLPKVDACITDPPYGIGASAGTGKSGRLKVEATGDLGWDADVPDGGLLDLTVAAGVRAVRACRKDDELEGPL